jgi:hypothetical protein
MQKSYIKKLLLISAIISSVLLFSTPKTKAANTLADQNDVFDIISPAPNSKIEGEIEVSWIMYDDDSSNIPFVAEILDANTCTQNFGSITNQPSAESNINTPFTINWQTTSTLNSTLPDGNYCLRICVELINTQSYSACNSRIITIVNQNQPPYFTQFPNDLILNENETFSFDLSAIDPDGDELIYRLTQAPNFVTLNEQTLKITAPFISNNQTSYPITIEVDDNLSGATMHSFTLTILKEQTNTQPQQSNQPNSTNTQDSTEINLKFISPQTEQTIKENEFQIEWETSSNLNIKHFELEYSTNLNTFFKIADINNTKRKYLWDIREIDDGSYYLRIKAILDNDVILSRLSDKFSVEKNGEQINVPLILNVSPANGAVVTPDITEIKGDLVPTQNSQIDIQSFKFLLNEQDLTELCVAETTKFTCTLKDPLEEAVHEAKIYISDTNNSENEFIWQFTVSQDKTTEESQIEDTKSTESNQKLILFNREVKEKSLILFLVICCSILILIFVPWILHAIWRKDNDETESDYFTQTEGTDVQYAAPTPVQTTISTNYVQPSPPPTQQDPYYTPPTNQQK